MAKIFKITRAASLTERLRDPFARPRTGLGCLSPRCRRGTGFSGKSAG